MQEITDTKKENFIVNCKKIFQTLFYPYNIYDFLGTLKDRIKVSITIIFQRSVKLSMLITDTHL